MVTELAKGDYEDMQAEGLRPTLHDFDRLNQLALRMEAGAESTVANHPRIGWAGDVPFHQPTFQAMVWYLECAERVKCDTETKNTFWYFALAHARRRDFFANLRTPDAIQSAVAEWAAALPVCREEVARACRYAVHGYDDAVAAKAKAKEQQDERGVALSRLHRRMMELVGVSSVSVAEAELMTQDGADAVLEFAYRKAGREYGTDEKRLQLDYTTTLAEIRARLEKERDDGRRD